MSFLLARDTVNGAEGSIVVTIDGKNQKIASMKNIRTTADIQSEDMRVIGTRKIQTKHNGVKLSGSGNIYYGNDVFRKMALQYINTGTMPEFSIQLTNNDPSTSLGQQVMAYYGCMLSGEIPLSILDDEEAMLNFDFNFTYTDVAILEGFNEPSVLGN